MKKVALTKLDLEQYNRVPILVVYKELSEDISKYVCKFLKDINIPYVTKVREKVTSKDFENDRIVIVIAGDGTTLRVAQRIRNNSLIIPVNSSPQTTEGALTSMRVDSFTHHFTKMMQGKAFVEKSHRIEASINGKILPYRAINEISLSKKQPYFTFMYEIFNHQERASGVLVCTPIGSTAWCKAAGGKKLSHDSNKIEYIIREPHQGKIFCPQRKYGIVEIMQIKILTQGILVFDSIPKEFAIKHNDLVEIKLISEDINFVRF